MMYSGHETGKPSPLVVWDARMIKSSGIGAYLRGLLPHLVKLAPEYGVKIGFIGPRKELEQFEFFHHAVCHYEFDASLFSVREQLFFPRLPLASAYHFPHYNLPVARKCHFFATVHDLIPLTSPKFARNRLHRKIVSSKIGAIARGALAIFVPSEIVKQDLLERFPDAAQKTYVIPYAVSPDIVPIENNDRARAIFQRYGIKQPYVLSVSIDKPHKNLRFLIRAVGELIARTRTEFPLQLVIAGLRPPDKKRLLQFCLRETPWLTSAHIALLDCYLSAEELSALYAGASAVVQPSDYEGFGMPVIEAQQTGVLVVLPDLPWAHSVAGEGALFFAPHSVESLCDVLRSALRDESLRQSIIDRGRSNVERYQWEKSAHGVLLVYGSLLGTAWPR